MKNTYYTMTMLSGSSVNTTFDHLINITLQGLDEIDQLLSGVDAEEAIQKMKSMDIQGLLQLLKDSHQLYLTKLLPEIEQSLAHLFQKHENSVALLGLAVFFDDYKNKLIAHIKMEEERYFPYVERLLKIQNGEILGEEAQQILASQKSEQFEEQHDSIETELQKVVEKIKVISAESSNPMVFNVFINQAQKFEFELRKHALIEDLLLLEKVNKLEAYLA